MPKLFPISLDVEETAVGRVLRILNSMPGVVRLHLNLAGETPDKNVRQIGRDQDDGEDRPETPAATPSGAKWRVDGRINSMGVKVSANVAYKAIADVLLRTPAHYKVLRAAIERIGIVHHNAIHGHLHRMHALKLIKRTAPGTYRLTEKGEKVFDSPSRQKRVPSSDFFKVVDNTTGVRHLILRTLHDSSDPIPSRKMFRVLEEKGYSTKNLSTTGMKMRNEGLIEVNDGLYALTETGQHVYENPPENDTSNPITAQQEITSNG